MPPPIQQSGSKAALITWTVITSILFVVATVMAIFAQTKTNKTEVELATLKQKYADVIPETDLGGAEVNELRATRDAYNQAPEGTDKQGITSELSLLQVARKQRDNLAKKISGAESYNSAISAVVAAVEQAKAVGVTDAATPGLVNGVAKLADTIKARTTEIEALKAQLKDAKTRLDSTVAATDEQIKAKVAEVEASKTEASKAVTDASADRTAKDSQVNEITGKLAESEKARNDAVNELTAKLNGANAENTKLKDTLRSAMDRLNALRPRVDQIMSQADGKIAKIAPDDIVYIDLGAGDQLTTGMSFEVYDRFEGIPKNPVDPLNDEHLPKGKASIEVIKVLAGVSECRVVRKTLGTTVVDGDIIVNLAYDKNTRNTFVVYGNFDLDRNGSATPQDADVVKRLITQWGGKVGDKLGIDTDFLVVGKEPEIPNFTTEELDDPLRRNQKDKAELELKAYQDIVATAVEYRIPILNQNRFLYFTGYYDQSAR